MEEADSLGVGRIQISKKIWVSRFVGFMDLVSGYVASKYLNQIFVNILYYPYGYRTQIRKNNLRKLNFSF